VTTTITIDGDDYVPQLIDGHNAGRESRNVQHAILGSNIDAKALRPAALRAGRLRALVATSEADALALLDALSLGLVATLVSTDRPGWDMTFILAAGGSADLTLDDTTRNHWWVEFDYQETTA
jgi:hypothetical protein